MGDVITGTQWFTYSTALCWELVINASLFSSSNVSPSVVQTFHIYLPLSITSHVRSKLMSKKFCSMSNEWKVRILLRQLNQELQWFIILKRDLKTLSSLVLYTNNRSSWKRSKAFLAETFLWAKTILQLNRAVYVLVTSRKAVDFIIFIDFFASWALIDGTKIVICPIILAQSVHERFVYCGFFITHFINMSFWEFAIS